MVDTSVDALIEWLDNSPTPFHVVATAQQLLGDAGFIQQSGLTHEVVQNGFLIRDGSLVAWRKGSKNGALRVIGAHTDSPNLRVQSNPDITQAGWAQLGLEIYGGVLLNSWLDRDLGIAGRVVDRDGQVHLFNVNEPLARVPQLAIHLDREISERGLFLDKHQHATPIWGVHAPVFADWIGEVSGAATVAAFDAHLYDITPASILGVDESMLVSARLDNQVSCWAALTALVTSPVLEHTVVVVLNDHEEVGSESITGAAGNLLPSLLSAIDRDHGLSDGAVFDMRRRSWCLSADNAHAVHPNYLERHDPRHAPRPNSGPALKLNGNQRYATTARGAAHLRSIAERAEIPMQTFMSRNNMPCGSTIGPITSTQLGIEAIDIGIPQLSMHSAREMCGSEDPEYLVALMTAFAQS
jgi:aspartyl aminopeptidase